MTRVTLDTNVLSKQDMATIKEAVRGHNIELATTTVNEREVMGSNITIPANPIVETGVWDESTWGNAVWGGSLPETLVIGESPIGSLLADSGDRFEFILKTITNGSFPKLGQREGITQKQRRQLRDAMIFDAHVRDGRDIFVTNDAKAFIGKANANRKQLQEAFKTRIMNLAEFCEYCNDQQ